MKKQDWDLRNVTSVQYVCINFLSLLSAVVRGILGWWQAVLWIRLDLNADPDPVAPHPKTAF